MPEWSSRDGRVDHLDREWASIVAALNQQVEIVGRRKPVYLLRRVEIRFPVVDVVAVRVHREGEGATVEGLEVSRIGDGLLLA